MATNTHKQSENIQNYDAFSREQKLRANQTVGRNIRTVKREVACPNELHIVDITFNHISIFTQRGVIIRENEIVILPFISV